jgi:hypothetical protein
VLDSVQPVVATVSDATTDVAGIALAPAEPVLDTVLPAAGTAADVDVAGAVLTADTQAAYTDNPAPDTPLAVADDALTSPGLPDILAPVASPEPETGSHADPITDVVASGGVIAFDDTPAPETASPEPGGAYSDHDLSLRTDSAPAAGATTDQDAAEDGVAVDVEPTSGADQQTTATSVNGHDDAAQASVLPPPADLSGTVDDAVRSTDSLL